MASAVVTAKNQEDKLVAHGTTTLMVSSSGRTGLAVWTGLNCLIA
jgi:hypothetical protein